jgi:hypothetical protein
MKRAGTFHISHFTAFYAFQINKHLNHNKTMNLNNVPVIFTTSFGLLFGPVGTFSILRKVSMPSMTLPKTTCFPSRKSQGAVVTKNYTSSVKKDEGGEEGGIGKRAWQPFVLVPELAYPG